MNNTIIYLIGFPGTGKYTIAKELVKKQPGLFLVDNHLINNPIFGLIRRDGKTKFPEAVWDYTRRMYDVVLDAVIHLADQESSFVFTNCLYNEYPPDRILYQKIQDVAEKRGALFFPIHLSCNLVELQKRIISPDRNARMKWMDPDGLAGIYEKYTILDCNHPCKLELDVTRLAAEETAGAILAHVEKCKG